MTLSYTQLVRQQRSKTLARLLTVLTLLRASGALALPVELPNLEDLVSKELQVEGVRIAGLLGAHRPYQSGTPLGTALGLDTAIEVSLVGVPQSLYDELAAAGLSSSFSIRSLPVAKLHLHKGISPTVDFGASYLRLPEIRIYGADVKWAFYMPEEGPTWALRLCYSQSSLKYFRVKSWSPQLLVSKKLSFADTYMGLEYTTMTGAIRGTQTVDVSGIPVTSELDIQGIKASGASAFLGVGLRVPAIGLKLGIEGAYSFVEAHSLGMTLGFSW